MTVNNKVDSNATGLHLAEEASIGVLPGSPVWIEQEPNEYGDFGGQVTTIARNPISADRQRRKGVVTDKESAASYTYDLTQSNSQETLQGFFFADLIPKGEAKNVTGVTTLLFAAANTGSLFTRSGTPAIDLTTQFSIGDLIFVAGFADTANNGLFRVNAVTTTTITASLADGTETLATLVDESANSAVSIVNVGIEATAGDLDVDQAGSRPALTSTTVDFTTLGLAVGEPMWIGGDVADTQFQASSGINNNLVRIRSIAATRIEFDKTSTTMITEASTVENIHLYFGRVLKNRTGSDIVRRTYQAERSLGKADTTDPNDQSEYVIGAVPNQAELQWRTADKMTMNVSYVGIDTEYRDGATGLKAGARVSTTDADAFNTSGAFSRIKLAVHDETDPNPTALFAFATDINISINNNASLNKGLGVTGGFDASSGLFEVGGSITAYFADIAAVQAVQNNADITLDAFIVQNNAGFVVDLPLLTLGDGRLNVVQDQAITIPLTNEAATGSKLDPNLNHTLQITFFDFLPTLADV